MNEETSVPALFEPSPAAPLSVTAESAVTRAAEEIRAAMVIAKKFPRDEAASYNRIMKACKRPSLAEVACYAYPRGGTTVTGPSIRLAEALAQNWGNLDFGIVELGQASGESQVMAYAWDLETNTRQTKVFTVKHQRRVGKGENFAVHDLTDPRDIYEMVANQGARRVRACILGVIPGDIIDAAVEACESTLKKGSTEPLLDRARKMISVFAEMGVTQGMIEQRLGHKTEAISEQEMVNLRRIYTSLKDGAAKREDFFQVEATKPDFDKPLTNGKKTTNMPEPGPVETPAESAKKQPPGSHELRAMAGLCKIAGVEEAEVLALLHRSGVDESLATLSDVDTMAHVALKHVHDNWSAVVQDIKNSRPKKGETLL